MTNVTHKFLSIYLFITLYMFRARCVRNMQRVINKNKYIERNLCVTLVVYQESLHDARSTKCKISGRLQPPNNSMFLPSFLSLISSTYSLLHLITLNDTHTHTHTHTHIHTHTHTHIHTHTHTHTYTRQDSSGGAIDPLQGPLNHSLDVNRRLHNNSRTQDYVFSYLKQNRHM